MDGKPAGIEARTPNRQPGCMGEQHTKYATSRRISARLISYSLPLCQNKSQWTTKVIHWENKPI
jgi:hypothetical protein